MKISELIKKLEEIRLEEGNLEVHIQFYKSGYYDYSGELTDMYTEERRYLYLLSEEEVTSGS